MEKQLFRFSDFIKGEIFEIVITTIPGIFWTFLISYYKKR